MSTTYATTAVPTDSSSSVKKPAIGASVGSDAGSGTARSYGRRWRKRLSAPACPLRARGCDRGWRGGDALSAGVAVGPRWGPPLTLSSPLSPRAGGSPPRCSGGQRVPSPAHRSSLGSFLDGQAGVAPCVDPTRHVAGTGSPVALQELDGLCSTAADAAVDVDVAVVGDLGDALGDLAERDQNRAGDARLLVLPGLAHVD